MKNSTSLLLQDSLKKCSAGAGRTFLKGKKPVLIFLNEIIQFLLVR